MEKLIRETLDKAVPGSWEWQIKTKPQNEDGGVDVGDLNHWKNDGMPRNGVSVLTVLPNKHGMFEISAFNKETAELIANASTWIRYLLDELENAKQERDEIDNGLDKTTVFSRNLLEEIKRLRGVAAIESNESPNEVEAD